MSGRAAPCTAACGCDRPARHKGDLCNAHRNQLHRHPDRALRPLRGRRTPPPEPDEDPDPSAVTALTHGPSKGWASSGWPQWRSTVTADTEMSEQARRFLLDYVDVRARRHRGVLILCHEPAARAYSRSEKTIYRWVAEALRHHYLSRRNLPSPGWCSVFVLTLPGAGQHPVRRAKREAMDPDRAKALNARKTGSTVDTGRRGDTTVRPGSTVDTGTNFEPIPVSTLRVQSHTATTGADVNSTPLLLAPPAPPASGTRPPTGPAGAPLPAPAVPVRSSQDGGMVAAVVTS